MSIARTRAVAGLAVVGAIAAVAAGCGGGGSDSLSASEFRTQADAICADANTRIAALGEPSAPDQYLGFLQSGLTIQQDQLDKLKALDPPSDLSATYDEALDLLQQRQTAISGAADRISGGEDPETVISDVNSDISSLGDQADQKAEDLGLTVCGTESTGETTDTTATTATVTTPTDTTADTTAATTSGGGTGDTAGYVTDVQSAASALTAFGTALSSVSSLDDLKTTAPQATAALDDFDEAIGELGSYTLPEATLEKQRAGLVRTGPRVSDVLRDFIDAAKNGDIAEVQKLLPEVQSAIQDFQSAATGG